MEGVIWMVSGGWLATEAVRRVVCHGGHQEGVMQLRVVMPLRVSGGCHGMEGVMPCRVLGGWHAINSVRRMACHGGQQEGGMP